MHSERMENEDVVSGREDGRCEIGNGGEELQKAMRPKTRRAIPTKSTLKKGKAQRQGSDEGKSGSLTNGDCVLYYLGLAHPRATLLANGSTAWGDFGNAHSSPMATPELGSRPFLIGR